MSDSQKKSLVGDAYTRLKEAIRTNQLPPGYQASEPEISEQLGMSRTPVREALIRLEAEKLVELIPRRGARVLPISINDMREIYEILASLESEAAANFASQKPGEDALKVVEQAMLDMEAAVADGDLEAWADADDRFHRNMVDMHGNQRLKDFILALNDQVHRTRIVTLRLRGMPVKSNEEHRKILGCLRKADIEGTRKAFRAHRERAAAELLELLEKFKITQL